MTPGLMKATAAVYGREAAILALDGAPIDLVRRRATIAAHVAARYLVSIAEEARVPAPTRDPHEVAYRRVVRCQRAADAMRGYPVIRDSALLSDTFGWCLDRLRRWNRFSVTFNP